MLNINHILFKQFSNFMENIFKDIIMEIINNLYYYQNNFLINCNYYHPNNISFQINLPQKYVINHNLMF